MGIWRILVLFFGCWVVLGLLGYSPMKISDIQWYLLSGASVGLSFIGGVIWTIWTKRPLRSSRPGRF